METKNIFIKLMFALKKLFVNFIFFIIFILIFAFCTAKNEDKYYMRIPTNEGHVRIKLDKIDELDDYIKTLSKKDLKNLNLIFEPKVITRHPYGDSIILLKYKNEIQDSKYLLIKVDSYKPTVFEVLKIGQGSFPNIKYSPSQNKVALSFNNRNNTLINSHISVLDVRNFSLIYTDSLNTFNNMKIPVFNMEFENDSTISVKTADSKNDYDSLKAWFEKQDKFKKIEIEL